MQLNSNKTNNPVKKKKKWPETLNRHFSERRHTDGPKTHEEMLNIANYLSNANQNCNEVSPLTSQVAIIKKSTNNKFWRGCGEEETAVHCWWECKLVQPLWKTVWRLLKTLKIDL